jgi:DNA-binding CsgD family transcriptional regulator
MTVPAVNARSRSSVRLLDLGLGRAESALARLETLGEGRRFFHIPATRSTPDLVEAAVRLGRPEAAAEPLALFETWSRNTGRRWTKALVHRCRALLDGDQDLFRAAIALHEQDHRPFDEARTRLLYGEWLRRGKRKADARTQLSAALEVFERIGAVPWAERTRTELAATGTTGRAADHGLSVSLTPQELQIVRLAAQGLSNKDIAAQLFLSSRTVGHHLSTQNAPRSCTSAHIAPASSPIRSTSPCTAALAGEAGATRAQVLRAAGPVGARDRQPGHRIKLPKLINRHEWHAIEIYCNSTNRFTRGGRSC